MKKSVLLAGLLVLSAGAVSAKVKLPALFNSNMVLQRETNAPVWGWANPGEKVEISGSWGAKASAVADKSGKWKTALKTPKAGGPFKVTVKGENTITLDNVMSGEVWLCSGQSNMGLPVAKVINAKDEIAAANYPNIRLFKVKLIASIKRKDDCVAKWKPCSPKTVPYFTAAGYFFGRDVYKELKDVPVGLIQSAWGGTCIEAWIPWEAQKDDKYAVARKAKLDEKVKTYDLKKEKDKLKKAVDKWKDKVAAWKKAGSKGKAPRRPRFTEHPYEFRNYPSNLYRGMIAPIEGYAIRGAIWYQGEANAHSADEASHYRKQIETLITTWRQIWGQGDFHFYYVQLPNYRKPWEQPVEEKDSWPYIRESFMKASKEVPNSDMAIAIDVGEANDIHPTNKQAVGNRLARLALNDVYKRKDIVRTGPVIESATAKDGKIILTFNNGGAALIAKGQTLAGFAVEDKNKKFHKAEAKIISANQIEVNPGSVKDAVMVYYAWANNPVGANLFNKADLPASPFRVKVK